VNAASRGSCLVLIFFAGLAVAGGQIPAPLITHCHIEANVLNGKEKVRVVVDHDYSRFQKFSATTMIVTVPREDKP
jgi:hypothetical protein